jgi:cytoplasmic iron level regulating protein YaaA (DUF328/UPF0246 family)
MLVLLPPSETKRDGGDDASPLDLASLGYPGLTSHRTAALKALRALSKSVMRSSTALGLGPTQRFEIDRNRALPSAATMPAIDRYTGVLFDGLEAASLDERARDWLRTHVVVHSALFGLVRAGDAIPAYRLSHDSKLPELPLRKHWAAPIARELDGHGGLILDLRSEAYAHLGPRPDGSFYLRVVTEAPDGRKRALNHFNKKGKGEFVRSLAIAGQDHESVDTLLAWASASGIQLAHGASGELELTV